MASVDEIDEAKEGVIGFSCLPTGSLESLQSLLKHGDTTQTSYLDLIQARHHYFTKSNPSKSTTAELNSILKDFEESYQISNTSAVSIHVHAEEGASNDELNDQGEYEIEEMELPYGEISGSSTCDNVSGRLLQVDNFVDDESMCSHVRHRNEANEADDETDDNVYVPSFGASPPEDRSEMATEASVLDSSVAVTESVQFSLDEMCSLLKCNSESDSDVDVESITDEYISRPIHLQLPIHKMDLKLTTQSRIRSDADNFLEHYINNMDELNVEMNSGDDDNLSGGRSRTRKEIVIDVADETNEEVDIFERGLVETSKLSNHFDESDIPLRARRIMKEHLTSGSTSSDVVVVVEEEDVATSGGNDRSFDDVEVFNEAD